MSGRAGWILTAAWLAAASGCSAANTEYSNAECARFDKSFFDKPTNAQIADFSGLELQAQYKVYICGSQNREPPLVHLAVPFAKEGGLAKPLLEEALARTHNDVTIANILLVFELMVRQKSYDVAADEPLMKVMAAAVERVKDPFWRQMSEQALAHIRKR